MKKIPYSKGVKLIGARYEFHRPEFGEDQFQSLTGQLEEVLSEMPNNPEAKIKEFYFFHPFYGIPIPIGTPTTLGELKENLEFFAQRKDRLHKLFLGTFLPDSLFAYQIEQ